MTGPGGRKGGSEAARAERELLARLGLRTKASNDEVEAAHVEIVKFLESAPAEVRRWAEREIAAVDEAYGLLSDQAADPVAADSAEPDPRRAARPRQRTPRRSPLFRRGVLAVAAAAVIAVVVVLVYRSGNDGSTSAATVTTATDAGAQVDQARVAQLMEKIKANPNDVASLTQLGDIFFEAGDYNVAGGWMQKVIAVDPKNVTARLALGAAQFNLGNTVAAKEQWDEVILLDPRNAEAYYDLGFLYLSQSPPDEARAKAAWNKVIEIAPDSDVAKTVATHLQSLAGSTAPAATAPSTAPASTAPPPTTTGK